MMSHKVSIGIDLGTTYSSISFFNNTRNEPELVQENNNASSFPSYVVLTGDQQHRQSYLYGQTAKNQAVSHAFFDSKRLIGKTYDEYSRMGTETNDWTFGVVEDDKGYAQMMTDNPTNNSIQEKCYPEEVSGMILMSLMKIAKERTRNMPIGNVVVTIPVDFSLAQRNATIRACKIAGIENVELMNEPSASIVEYKRYIEKEGKGTLTEGTKILVIDFGGGTLDVCCCQIGRSSVRNETNVQVIRTGGDQDLGGKHFDEVVRDLIMEKIQDDYQEAIPLFTFKSTDPARIKKAKKARKWKVMIEAEKAKIELSKTSCVQISLEPILGVDYVDEFITISRAEFEEKCSEKLLKRFTECVERVLRDASLTKSDIDLILPIGGSCNIPIVKATIDRMFPERSKRADPLFDSLSAVSKGAAYQAFRYQTSGVDNDDTLVEKLPYGVGVELVRQEMLYYADKGDRLPVKEKVHKIYLNRDFQEVLTYPLYIGNEPKSDGPGMKYQKKLSVTVPPKTRISDFVTITTMTITKSGLILFNAKKEKDGKFLGKMECQLEMNFLDNNITTMRRHVLQFCN